MRRFLSFCAMPALLFYVSALIIMSGAGFELLEILRDPPQITGQSSFLGLVSNVGVWLWVAAATLCLSRAAPADGSTPRARRRLLMVGGFSLVLAMDDFFMIHDRFIAEGIVIPLYAVFIARLAYVHADAIFGTDALSFSAAGVFEALSIATDSVQEILPLSYSYNQALEEGLKFLGAASWLYFCYRLSTCPSPAVARRRGG